MNIEFKRFYSVDSHKAIKAQGFGFLNGINYMAPHKSGGVGNLCSDASPICILLCLGRESGQAAMVSKATGTNLVRQSRERKARFFMKQNKAYMLEMAWHTAKLVATARKANLVPVARPNGSTDIAYERIKFFVSVEYAATLSSICGETVEAGQHTLFSLFPFLQFVDYTKIASRFDKPLPPNYYLTFSRSETNEAQCIALLARGINVAVVFGGTFPRTWNGHRVINGDKHDLRHLDPRHGHVVGLTPKGHKAKRDRAGFVVREVA